MKIVVCVKQTADTAATVTVQKGEVSWGDTPLVLNPWDEYAVEEALLTKEKHGGTVTALSLGPEEAREALKQALTIGSDDAVLLSDPALNDADTLVVARALAKAIEKLGEVDLAFFGRASVDSAAGILYAQTARCLGWPCLSQVAGLSALDPASGGLTVERLLQEGRQVVQAKLPAVISVVKEINEPRYPSFMGIRKASRAEIPVWSAADVGMSDAPAANVSWPEIVAPPRVEVTCEFIEGDSPQEQANRLADRLIEEKLI